MDHLVPGNSLVYLNNAGKSTLTVFFENDGDASVHRIWPDGSEVDPHDPKTPLVFPKDPNFVTIVLYQDGSVKLYESQRADGSHVLLNFAPGDSATDVAFGPDDAFHHGALLFSSITSPQGYAVDAHYAAGHLTDYLLKATDPGNPVQLQGHFDPQLGTATVSLLNSVHGGSNPLVNSGIGNIDLLINQDGASLINQDGASLISQDGASLINQDGASLINQDGASLAPSLIPGFIGAGAAGIISTDGASLLGQGASGIFAGAHGLADSGLAAGGASLIGNEGVSLAGNLLANFALGTSRYSLAAFDDGDDFGASVASAGTVAVNGATSGTLEHLGDEDWFAVQLVAGHSYVIDVKGASTGAGTLIDPALWRVDSTGTMLQASDDGGAGLDARLVLTPDSSGTVYLVARGYQGASAGSYTISVTEADAAPTITSNGGGDTALISVPESLDAHAVVEVTTLTGTDLVSGSTLVYTIVGGADAKLFDLNPGNGILSFKLAPDYEQPRDTNHDNVYRVTVQARDEDGLVDTQALTIKVGNVTEPIFGTPGDDTIDPAHAGSGGAPTEAADTISGLGGNDTLDGADGNDIITGGAGDDHIVGGAGSDIAVFSGTQAAYSLSKDDLSLLVTISGPDGTDTLSGVEWLKFDDATIAAPGWIVGTSGSDNGATALVGTSGNDAFAPLTGTFDEVFGQDGIDRLIVDYRDLAGVSFVTHSVTTGGVTTTSYAIRSGDPAHNDAINEVFYDSIEAFTVQGSLSQANTLQGQAGDDVFIGGFKGDHFETRGGNDIVDLGGSGDAGSTTFFDYADLGQGGDDLLIADYSAAKQDVNFGYNFGYGGANGLDYGNAPGGSDVNVGGVGVLTFAGVERFTVKTGSGNDTILTGANADTISADAGDDRIDSGKGHFTVDGGAGVDAWRADLSDFAAGVSIDLTTPSAVQTLADGSTVKNVERLGIGTAAFVATQHDDTLTLGSDFSVYGNAIETRGGDDIVTLRGSSTGATSGVNSVDLGLGGDDLLVADYSAAQQAVSFAYNLGYGGANGTDYGSAPGGGSVTMGSVGVLTFAGVERFTVKTGSGNDTILTGANADTISAGGGDDRIDSGKGHFTIDGGAGIDAWRADLSDFTAGVSIDLTTPATVQTLADGSTVRNVERLGVNTAAFVATQHNDTLTLGSEFGAYGNAIETRGGDDIVTLFGGSTGATSGFNTVDLGQGGDDLLVVDYSVAEQAVSFAYNFGYGGANGLDYGSAPGGSSVSVGGVGVLTFAGVERFTVKTGSGDDTILTGAHADSISAGGGDDRIDSGRGHFTINGGTGIDAWRADLSDLAQGITLDLSAPASVQTLADGSSVQNVERLGIGTAAFVATQHNDTLTLGADFSAYGNAIETRGGDDIITLFGGSTGATSGFNSVDLGNGGDDLLVADYSAAKQAVNFTYNLGYSGGAGHDYGSAPGGSSVTVGSSAVLTFSGVERFTVRTGAGDDTILTGANVDTISAGAGNDQVDSGGGADLVIFSGARADYSVARVDDHTIAVTGFGYTDTLKNVEQVQFDDGVFDLARLADNHAPSSAAIADQHVAEDTPWSFQFAAFSDADSDALSYSATLGDGGALPDWLSFAGAERRFTGTPPANFSGNVALEVTGSDGLASHKQAFTLVVDAVNDAPSAIGLSHVLASIAENSSTATRLKVAEIAITDVDGGNNVLSLAGADKAAFELGGTTLYLKADTKLDFESKNSFALSLVVDDPSLGTGPELTQALSLAVADVNEAPKVTLSHQVTALLETDASVLARKVADLAVADDKLGSNVLSLSGADAKLFQIVGSQLQLKAGVQLDYESNKTLDVTVNVDDPSLGSGVDGTANLSIAIKDVPEITGKSGADTLTGKAAGELIDGKAGNDTITGGDGKDVIIGGLGVDKLSGGAAADTFLFKSVEDSGHGFSGYLKGTSFDPASGAGHRDVITDFTPGSDRLDLSWIDANGKPADGDTRFSWKGNAAFSKHAGELVFRTFDLSGTKDDKTIVYGDTDGDGKADLQIELSGLKHLGSSDFIL